MKLENIRKEYRKKIRLIRLTIQPIVLKPLWKGSKPRRKVIYTKIFTPEEIMEYSQQLFNN